MRKPEKKKTSPKKNGRKPKYTLDVRKKIFKVICDRITQGECLRKACDRDGMPHFSTVRAWIAEYPDMTKLYVLACQERRELLAEQIIDIADDGTRDERIGPDGVKVIDHDHISRSRLRVDARKWYLSKMEPKKYGDFLRQEVGDPNGNPLPLGYVIVPAKKDYDDAEDSVAANT